MPKKIYFTTVAVFLLLGSVRCPAAAPGASFHSSFDRMPDRIWIGPDVWANPMDNWRIAKARLECTTAALDRNVQVLTHQMSERQGSFVMSVRLGLIAGSKGSVGFLLGVRDEINDYRGNLLFGTFLPEMAYGTGDPAFSALLGTDGMLRMANQSVKIPGPSFSMEEVILTLAGVPEGENIKLTLTAAHPQADSPVMGVVEATVPAKRISGNIALTQTVSPGNPFKGADARFWFNDWRISGDKLDVHPGQTFGPVLFAMHSLSDSRSPEGFVMKMSAQMPPIGADDSQSVTLEVERGQGWEAAATRPICPDARTAVFRIPHWPADQDVPYRLRYQVKTTDGKSTDAHYEGTVRKQPAGRPLVMGALTCQFHTGFPYTPLVNNLRLTNPDLLFFSGDQLYENNGGYGIIRNPPDRAIISYLRKWYLFGWAFGDLMRDRPTLCLPDDHDVFHPNLWGEGGAQFPGKDLTGADTGYIQPVRMINVVHQTNCGHHPDFFEPAPSARDISVYYGDMVYGRVSFAILADRQFKSGPHHVKVDSRGDWVRSPQIDIASLDKPGLQFLGERQMRFLDHWVEDWRGADMKVVLSQTVFANVATHHGAPGNRVIADLDSGGWPQTPRNEAVRLLRKAFPLHVQGDQHLSTLLQYGVDGQRDAFWSFNTPAICTVYQRWWRPDEVGMPHANRPDPGLPNTGEYREGFNHPVYVVAVGNPRGTGAGKKNRYAWTEDRAGGFGIVRVDTAKRTYTCESYRFLIDLNKPGPKDQFPGWPWTIQQRENNGRKVLGHLPEVHFPGIPQPVLKVYSAADNQLVYAIRLTENRVKPWVFEPGVYTVKLGDPDTDHWQTFQEQTLLSAPKN